MPLASKLKLTADKPLYLVNSPAKGFSLFADMDIKTRLSKTGELEQVFVFAADKKTLTDAFSRITPRLSGKAIFWAAYPKKTSGMQSDLLKMESWSFIFEAGYIIASSAAIDDTWSGIRIKKKDLNANYVSAVPMEERKVPGIDYVNRTVKLPKDAVKAMSEFPELESFFNSMSFTHKREHVEAIEDAKKPETRRRRIDKMIEMVIELREKKERKKK